MIPLHCKHPKMNNPLLVLFFLLASASCLELAVPPLSRRELVNGCGVMLGSGLLLPPSTKADLSSSSSVDGVVMPKVKYGKSELELSSTIQGYWQLAGGHGDYDVQAAKGWMSEYVDKGFTSLDTADIYGPSESIVGSFARTNAKATPLTKCCCFRFLNEIDKAEVRSRVKKSMDNLGVDQIPLLQFFWSNYSVKRYVDVLLMLFELKAEGMIREIGVTNFDLERLKEMKKAGCDIVVSGPTTSPFD